MTVRKYSFLLANSSHKYIWELYVLAKYGNFVLNIQNFEKTPQTFLNEYQKSNWFLKKKVICQNSSQTVLTPAIIWELFAKRQADRPNCHYSSVTVSTQYIQLFGGNEETTGMWRNQIATDSAVFHLGGYTP